MALMVVATVALRAQDVITLANGESFYAKNIRFSGDKVYFNRWTESGTSQSVTTLSTSGLSKIVYESGEEEFFQKENPNAKVNYNTGNTVNVNVTGPVNNNNVGNSSNYSSNGYAADYSQTGFLDNPHFKAYAEGLGALFFVNNMNNNKFCFFISSSNIKNSYDGYYIDYFDAPSWYLPIFADVRFFYTFSDELSLFGQLSAGVEFNSYSGKRSVYDNDKCGKLYLNLAMGMEINKITASMGVMVFQSMYREEQYYDNYYTGIHSHSVGYYKESIPVLYLKVGYKFGE